MHNDFVIVDNETFDYVYKFESNGGIDENTKKNIDDTRTNKFISYFDLKQFISDNKQSYRDKLHGIHTQFEKDFSRQTIILNGVIYNDKEKFIEKINLLLNNTGYVPFYMRLIFPFSSLSDAECCQELFDVSYKDLILLLCCQSSFYLPYQILKNVYDAVDDNIILVSGSGGSENITITLNITQKNLTIELSTNLFVKNIAINKVIKKIQVELLANIDFNETHIANSHIVVFTWNILR